MGFTTVERFASGDGIVLVGDCAGPVEAPAVVLRHGGGQTRHSWSGAMTALVKRGYRVMNYDARGHGDSQWSASGAYSLDDRVADLRAVVRDVPDSYALVGASLGGATAIHAAASGLDPAAIVVVDIVPEPEPAGIARIVDFMQRHPEGFATLDEAADAVAGYNPDRARPDDSRGLMRNLRLRDDGRLYWHWDPLITATPPAVHHAEVQRSAARLAARDDVAVMLVRGMKSDVVGDAGVRSFRALMPRLEVVDVGGAGHMVAGDRNDAFNAGVIDFLDRRLPIEAKA